MERRFCISGVCGNAFTPIFSYQEHENNICETGGESTYVKYNQVCENEFCYNPERKWMLVGPKKEMIENIMKSENITTILNISVL